MPGDDHVDTGAKIDLQRPEVVQDIDRLPSKAHDCGVRVFASPLAVVHISSDGGDGCNPAKGVDDLGPPDVAGMNDVVEAGQASFRLRPQQTVRVRNNSNPEHHSSGAPPTIAKRRSRNTTWPDSSFVRAASISN